MSWKVYYWKAGKQFVIGDNHQIVDLFGSACFTRRYTQSSRPKTLTYICELKDFCTQAKVAFRESEKRK